MRYFLSAFRHTKHPDGYVMVDKLSFETIEDAISWVYTNMFRARTETAEIRFDAKADRNGITEMIAEYEGEWSMQQFDQLNGIEATIIQRADIVDKADGNLK